MIYNSLILPHFNYSLWAWGSKCHKIEILQEKAIMVVKFKSPMLDKLTYYGVCGLENLLLRNYLSGRHQYVDYNGSKSRTNPISLGAPQGSILGPLLFLIYINDLPKVSHVFNKD